MSRDHDGSQLHPATDTASPAVSIVTVYYNRVDHVADSIQSLLDQSLTDIEIIAVDDGSADGTAAALKKFSDPRLRIIEQKNSGFVVGINHAIRASRGRYVAIHGSGDISFPGRIAAQSAVLDSMPTVGVVGCYVQNQDPFDPSRFDYFKSKNGLNFFQTLIKETLFTHGEVMFRRQLFDQVGGYREFFRFAQDRDLWLRMSLLANYHIVPEPLYKRFKLNDGVGTSAEKLILQGLLSDFAVQCALSREAHGKDLLDRFGAVAPLLRTRSRALAARYCGFARQMLFAGKPTEARRMLAAARDEKPMLKIGYLAAMLWIQSRAPWMWLVMRPVLLSTTRIREKLRK